MRFRICAPVLVLSIAFSGLAQAQARSPAAVAQGAALFKEGRAAVERGDYPTACPRFEESQKLDPSDGTLFNLADCEEHLRHFLSAAKHWREGAAMLPPDDQRRPVLEQKASAAEQRAAKLTVRLVPGAPSGIVVKLDGAQVAAAGLGVALPLDPGEHVVMVQAPGRADRSFPVHLDEGQSGELPVAPGPELAPAVVPPPVVVAPVVAAPVVKSAPVLDPAGNVPEAKPLSFTAQHRWSLIGVGVAAGLAGAGLGLGIRTLSHHKEFIDACNAHDTPGCLSNRDAVAHEATAANVLFGVAGAAVVTSGVLFFTVEAREKNKTPSVGFAPSYGGMTMLVQY